MPQSAEALRSIESRLAHLEASHEDMAENVRDIRRAVIGSGTASDADSALAFRVRDLERDAGRLKLGVRTLCGAFLAIVVKWVSGSVWGGKP